MERISTFKTLSIVVIGDLMLDSYWYGDTDRISPEAPVPVVRVGRVDKRPGGAANVALNIKSIGAKVKLIGICGDDEEGIALKNSLNACGIEHTLIENTKFPTINKLRILSQSQQLMRLDFERSYESLDKQALNEAFIDSLSTANMVVISDYAKGTLTDVPFLIEACKKRHIPVLIDPKGEDYTKYSGASMLTPNRKEFELVMGESFSMDEFCAKGQKMLQDFHLESLLVTRGAEGMTLFRYSHEPYHLEANAHSVYDVTGAGDTVIGVLSTCLSSGMSYESALILANYAAGLVVGEVGAATVTANDLKQMDQSKLELSYFELSERIKIHHQTDTKAYRVNYEQFISDMTAWEHFIALNENGAVIYVLIASFLSLEEQKKARKLLGTIDFIEGVASLSDEEKEKLCLQKIVAL